MSAFYEIRYRTDPLGIAYIGKIIYHYLLLS